MVEWESQRGFRPGPSSVGASSVSSSSAIERTTATPDAMSTSVTRSTDELFVRTLSMRTWNDKIADIASQMGAELVRRPS